LKHLLTIALLLAAAPAPASDYDPLLPEGARSYQSARYTQSIAILNERDVIRPVSVASLPDTRWHQPGGMEGLTGWESERYRYLPAGKRVTAWIGNVEVENGIPDPRRPGKNYTQRNRAILREYPVGTRFDELLRNKETGRVFEHRVRIKSKGGKWLSEVWFKDETQFPAGYTGLTVSCSSCHAECGTGKYDAGLVPGGDGVFSDPLEWSLVVATSPEPAAKELPKPKRDVPKYLPDPKELQAKPAPKGFAEGLAKKLPAKPAPKAEQSRPKPAPKSPYEWRFLGYDRTGRPLWQLVPCDT
jgi:hypothetical protein